MKLLFLAFRYVAARGRDLLCRAPQLVTAARAGVCQPEGCSILHVFFLFLFLFNESPQKRPNAVWRQIWQDVGPEWE